MITTKSMCLWSESVISFDTYHYLTKAAILGDATVILMTLHIDTLMKEGSLLILTIYNFDLSSSLDSRILMLELPNTYGI